METRRYGKPVKDILKIKNDFFTKNDSMLALSHHQADALLIQPERKNCKICHTPIGGEPLYSSQRMEYFLCPVCGHLNSRFEDTEDFAEKVYISDDYLSNYSEDDRKKYMNRRDTIYIPKARFLIDALKEDGLGTDDIHLLDDGAGSGYFVSAARELGISDAEGIEISGTQTEFANRMAGGRIITQADPEKIVPVVRNTQCNVISFIGVFEHIINLDEILAAIKDNQNIHYVYFSVPMFSMSCVFEAAHQNCYNRHAGGTHTHLFSDSSIKYMADIIGFSEYRSWKFGSDMMDLYRMLCVSLDQGGNTALKDYFSPKFLNMIDDLQLVVDKNEFASEIHMILRREDR